MRREVRMEEISDGKLYRAEDMVGPAAGTARAVPPAAIAWEIP